MIDRKLLEVIFTDLDISISWVVITEEFQPLSNDILTDSEIASKLSREQWVTGGSRWAQYHQLKVLWEQGQGVINASSIAKEVNDVAFISILDTTNLTYFNKDMDASNQHLFNLSEFWQAGDNITRIKMILIAVEKGFISESFLVDARATKTDPVVA